MTDHKFHQMNNNEQGNLALVAGAVLGAMPPRMPKRLSTPSGCAWCGDRSGWAHRDEDPGAWVLHVLREHLRNLASDMGISVSFNKAGGATVAMHDAYPEDVALFRDALGVQISCVLEYEHNEERQCTVNFGTNPYGREVTMVWYTTPSFLHLAASLAATGWPFHPTL